MPLFSGFNNANYYDVILHCTRATLGDVVIALIAFLFACAIARSRIWLLEFNTIPAAVYYSTGIIITIGFEILATGPLNRWQYSEFMPLLPLVEVGVSPVAQWVVIPALVLWLSKRQLLGTP